MTPGDRFGYLVVVTDDGETCECICACGRSVSFTTDALRAGASSCGCVDALDRRASENAARHGERYRFLVPIGMATPKNRAPRIVCLCACGRETVQFRKDVKRGILASCGCVGALGRQASRNASHYRSMYNRQHRQPERPAAGNDAIAILQAFGRPMHRQVT